MGSLPTSLCANATTLFKRGKNGEMYSKEISPSDWKVPAGYEAKVQLKSEREENDNVEFSKIQYVKGSYLNNPTAQRIAKRKELELLGWDPDEVDEVMQAEEQMMMAPQVGPDGQPLDPAMASTTPDVPTSPLAPQPA